MARSASAPRDNWHRLGSCAGRFAPCSEPAPSFERAAFPRDRGWMRRRVGSWRIARRFREREPGLLFGPTGLLCSAFCSVLDPSKPLLIEGYDGDTAAASGG